MLPTDNTLVVVASSAGARVSGDGASDDDMVLDSTSVEAVVSGALVERVASDEFVSDALETTDARVPVGFVLATDLESLPHPAAKAATAANNINHVLFITAPLPLSTTRMVVH